MKQRLFGYITQFGEFNRAQPVFSRLETRKDVSLIVTKNEDEAMDTVNRGIDRILQRWLSEKM